MTTLHPKLVKAVRNICPYCDFVTDGIHALDGDDPNKLPIAGQFTVCVCCAQILRFNDDCSIRRVDDAELKAYYAANPDAQDALEYAQDAIKSLDRRTMFDPPKAPSL